MKQLPQYEVAVILINYNSSYFTIQCIESIVEKTAVTLNYQIVIIDNNSEKEDFLLLENYIIASSRLNLKLVRSKINTGFGGGNMFGVQFADAIYYAFINNDSILLNDCLSTIISEMKSNPEMGICGPMCYKEDGSLLPTLDHFASPVKEIFGRAFLEKWKPIKYPNRKIKYTKPKQGQFVAGSFMLVKAIDFELVGGFDTNIFLYYEETDLCIRLAKINKFAYLIPTAEFIHFHGASTPRSTAIKGELKISFLYVIRKHYGYFWHKIILNKLRFQLLIKSVFKPKNWKLFFLLVKGAPLSESLKLKQQIR